MPGLEEASARRLDQSLTEAARRSVASNGGSVGRLEELEEISLGTNIAEQLADGFGLGTMEGRQERNIC